MDQVENQETDQYNLEGAQEQEYIYLDEATGFYYDKNGIRVELVQNGEENNEAVAEEEDLKSQVKSVYNNLKSKTDLQTRVKSAVH
jgi:hypothetical protein